VGGRVVAGHAGGHARHLASGAAVNEPAAHPSRRIRPHRPQESS
jgi:hypothetical protein